jgi:hypothetical protein
MRPNKTNRPQDRWRREALRLPGTVPSLRAAGVFRFDYCLLSHTLDGGNSSIAFEMVFSMLAAA